MAPWKCREQTRMKTIEMKGKRYAIMVSRYEIKESDGHFYVIFAGDKYAVASLCSKRQAVFFAQRYLAGECHCTRYPKHHLAEVLPVAIAAPAPEMSLDEIVATFFTE